MPYEKGSGYQYGEKIKLVALGNLVINFELGCKVISLNL